MSNPIVRSSDPLSDPNPIANLDVTGDLPTDLSDNDTPFLVNERSSRADPSTAAVVPGYEILGVLGRGGMGVVYEARQIAANRIVALKMILRGEHASPADLQRFQREAEAAARLSHPNIVHIYEVGTHQGLPYFTLEYVAGGNLAQQLAGNPQPARHAAELVEVLARAMQHAHQNGVVHRDLKPANILLTKVESVHSVSTKDDALKTGSPRAVSTAKSGLQRPKEQTPDESPAAIPKITDFGLARQLDADTGQTHSGAIMGTPSYMAPEQALGLTKHVGPEADTYALGAILYECLTGLPPFKGASQLETLEQVRRRDPVPVRQLRPSTPRDLETICLKCLAKEPPKRYASAGELANDLRRFLNGEPIVARPVGPVEHAWKWVRRNPIVAGLLAGIFVVLLAGITSVLIAYNREADARPRRGLSETKASGVLERSNEGERGSIGEKSGSSSAEENCGRKVGCQLGVVGSGQLERSRHESRNRLWMVGRHSRGAATLGMVLLEPVLRRERDHGRSPRKSGVRTCIQQRWDAAAQRCIRRKDDCLERFKYAKDGRIERPKELCQ